MRAPPGLVDSHAHLDSEVYHGRLTDVLKSARAAGVTHILTVGTSLESALQAISISERHPEVAAAAGIHPNYIAEKGGDFNAVAALFDSAKLVAVGETGLDFYRDFTPRKAQHDAFRRHIELALSKDLPVIVHVREAYDEAIEVIDSFEKPPRGVFHCFSGDAAFAEEVLKRGFFISVAGQLSYRKADSLRAVAAGLPLGRLMVETDCPYLTPVPHRSKTNEPAYLALTAEVLAGCIGESLEDTARSTTANAWRLFGMGEEPPRGVVAYALRGNLYLNITNRCTNQCPWCVRYRSQWLAGYHLELEREPTCEEVIKAVEDAQPHESIVFCGYGEPTERLDIVKRAGAHFRKSGMRVRLDTNGLGSLSAGRDIVPELAGSVDAVSVSLNSASAKEYERICRPAEGAKAHAAAVDFVIKARDTIGDVKVTAVDLPGVDTEAIRSLARRLGVKFRLRAYSRYA